MLIFIFNFKLHIVRKVTLPVLVFGWQKKLASSNLPFQMFEGFIINNSILKQKSFFNSLVLYITYVFAQSRSSQLKPSVQSIKLLLGTNLHLYLQHKNT